MRSTVLLVYKVCTNMTNMRVYRNIINITYDTRLALILSRTRSENTFNVLIPVHLTIWYR